MFSRKHGSEELCKIRKLSIYEKAKATKKVFMWLLQALYCV